MKNLFLFIAFSLYINFFYTQHTIQDFCASHKILNEQLKNEAFRVNFEATRNQLATLLNELKQDTTIHRGEVYTIPVVFHVLHNGGSENISEEQILDALRILNRDYRRLNEDYNDIHNGFQAIAADIEVQFVLATKAPNGTCFTGITRTQSEWTNSDDGWAQVEAIINGNDIFNGEWSGDKYLNFFVCKEIGFGAAGYTYLPGSIGNSMNNGIWVLSEYVGSIGTGEEGRSRVLTHEVGHWLDLPHTWGYSNDPGLPENCNDDDGIEDTPNTVGVSFCNLNQAVCGPIANVENYMDYSYCSKMFTEGQKLRMRATLNSFVDGRNNLITAQNIAETGADGNLYLCEARFNVNKKNICLGEAIEFTDLSYNKATSWSWTFEGGIPSTSNEQNPIIVYPNSGVYTVKLVVSDGLISDSVILSNLITVANQSLSLPFYEGFESFTTLANNVTWKIENDNANQTFQLLNGTANSGTKSTYIDNFNQVGFNQDELISTSINLGNVIDTVTLSFRYAYHKKPDVDNEKLQVFVSSDCGVTWQLKRTLTNLLLSNGESNEAWFPTSSEDWRIAHVTNIFSSSWSENFQFKFRFLGQGGNNVFIDDINIYTGGPSEEIFSQVNLEELNQTEFSVFPNPIFDQIILNFNSDLQQNTEFCITNNLGEKVFQINKNIEIGENNILLENISLASGIYFLNFKWENSTIVKKLQVR